MGGWFRVSLVFCFGPKLKFKLETWTKLNKKIEFEQKGLQFELDNDLSCYFFDLIYLQKINLDSRSATV